MNTTAPTNPADKCHGACEDDRTAECLADEVRNGRLTWTANLPPSTEKPQNGRAELNKLKWHEVVLVKQGFRKRNFGRYD